MAKVTSTTIAKFKLSQVDPYVNQEIILEIQVFEDSKFCLNILLNYPSDTTSFFQLFNKKSENFRPITNEDEDDLSITIIDALELLVALFVKLFAE